MNQYINVPIKKLVIQNLYQNGQIILKPCISQMKVKPILTMKYSCRSYIKYEVRLGQKSIQVISSARGQLPHCWKYLQEKTAVFFVVQQCLHTMTGVKGEKSN